MITGDINFCVLAGVHAKDSQTYYDICEKIKEDLISVIKHYEAENTDEIKVYLRDEPRCARCHETYPKCQCGRPHRSPAV